MTVPNTPAAPVRNMPSPGASAPTAKMQNQRPGAAPAARPHPAAKPFVKADAIPFWSGLAVSVVWTVGVLVAVAQAGPARSFAGAPRVAAENSCGCPIERLRSTSRRLIVE